MNSNRCIQSVLPTPPPAIRAAGRACSQVLYKRGISELLFASETIDIMCLAFRFLFVQMKLLKGFARGLVLKQRLNVRWKRPIS